VLRGTYNPTRHGRDRAGEPVAPGDLPVKPPEGLTESQSAIWRQAMEAAPKGILKLADFHTFLTWVVAADQHEVARCEQARLDAASDQPLVVQRNGALAPSPYVDIMHRAQMRMMKAGEQLGFSPTSRPRLAPGQPQEKPDDEWSELGRIVGRGNAWGKLAEPLEPQ
jgi:P27 family predicted phage terminase small subunit